MLEKQLPVQGTLESFFFFFSEGWVSSSGVRASSEELLRERECGVGMFYMVLPLVLMSPDLLGTLLGLR